MLDATPLSRLPTQVASWVSHDIPLEDGLERILRADANLQREYSRSESEPPIWLYVGYYGTERGGRPEHTPDICYPAASWAIVEESTIARDPSTGIAAIEYVVEFEGNRRLVHYGYRSRTRTGLLGRLPLGLEHLRGRISDGRADGALVRISTTLVQADSGPARARLSAFTPQIDALIASHWPDEFPGARSSSGVDGTIEASPRET